MDLYKDTMIVGYTTLAESIKQGGAWIFQRNTEGAWVYSQSWPTKDLTADSGFGMRVAIGEKFAAVSAPKFSNVKSNAGLIYVLPVTGSGSLATTNKLFYEEEPKVATYLGSDLAISGDILVTGMNPSVYEETKESAAISILMGEL